MDKAARIQEEFAQQLDCVVAPELAAENLLLFDSRLHTRFVHLSCVFIRERTFSLIAAKFNVEQWRRPLYYDGDEQTTTTTSKTHSQICST